MPRGGKQPYYFRLKTAGQFAMGGLWERWTSPEGKRIESYCVVTVEANELVAPIHDRMPLILDDAGARLWMDPGASPADVEALLKPFPAGQMETYPVNTLVSSPKTEGEICIQHADVVYELTRSQPAKQGELF